MAERSSTRGSPLPSVLRDYAFIGDGHRGAVIGPRGDVVWLCTPRWESDAIFSTLVGGAGSYSICPADPWFVWGGYYEDGSLIWRSRWATSDGFVESREALAFPGDPHRAVLLRRVSAIGAPSEIAVRLDPRAGFGRYGMRDLRWDDNVLEARTGSLRLRWQGPRLRPERASGALVGTITLAEGEAADLVLEIGDRPFAHEPVEADSTWSATENAWKEAAPRCADTAAPRDSRHAYVVLRGLTTPGGGMAAAATTSLPERAEAGRNYDYRYAWIRDQCIAGLAVASNGHHGLLDEAVQFVAERLLADGPSLKPAYCVDGSPVPDQRVLKGLRGYPGGSDIAGNWVNKQMQLDAFGESLLLFAAAEREGALTSEARQAVDVAVGAIESLWDTPDAGIWELEPDWWAHSRLECVAGLRQVASGSLACDAGQAARWQALADFLLAETAKRSTHPTGRWQRSPGDERVDAALLLPAIRGALPASDPRSVATLEAVLGELSADGYCYRFRHDGRPLAEAEGAFLLCGFATSLALLECGRPNRAARCFERNRTACGSPGLFAEEYDVDQRQLRGNLPQAFVHAMMLECAVRLGRDDAQDA
jgi:GH15 family glucan-1,4-alpha-glucosidase